MSYQTAWRWVKDGKMPMPVRQAPSGTWLVDESAPAAVVEAGRVVVYCRVSSADQRADLDRQAARVLSDPQAGVIVVEHRDRLARFGVEHLEEVLSASGRRLVVLDPTETADGLVRDITEVLTSMCARLYGRRAAKNRAARAVAVATGEAAG